MPMSEEILVNHTAHETRIALVQQGVVQELHIERAASRGLVGNVYLGRVARVLPGMQSAFIDIGLERAAFLHVADLWQSRANSPSSGHALPIEKVLFEGKPLLVQVIKDPLGTKGARLSSQISIAGRMLVYLPQDPHIGVSQRIERDAERARLKAGLQGALGADERGGFIIRTSAEDASEADLAADVAYLRKRWQEILDASQRRPAPALLYQELSLTERVLRDVAGDETASIAVDSAEECGRMVEFANTYVPSLASRLRTYAGERPLFELHGVEGEIEKALGRRVDHRLGPRPGTLGRRRHRRDGRSLRRRPRAPPVGSARRARVLASRASVARRQRRHADHAGAPEGADCRDEGRLLALAAGNATPTTARRRRHRAAARSGSARPASRRWPRTG